MADVNTAIASYQLDLKQAGYIAGAKQVDVANQQMVGSMAQVEAGSEGVTISTTKIGTEFDKLEAKINRRVAIEQQLAANLERATRVGQEEGIAIQRVDALKAQYIARSEQQIAAIDRVRFAAANQNTVLNQGIGVGRSFGSMIQQAGFQVGDFAVQVASGSGVLRPFIQQGTQLVSMFGPGGAIIGAIGAIIGAFVTFAIKTEDATEATKRLVEEQKNLKLAIGEVSNEIVLATGLLGKYLGMAGEAVNAQLATQGKRVHDLRAELQSMVDLAAEFQSAERPEQIAKMLATPEARALQVEIDNAQRVLDLLAEQSIKLAGISAPDIPLFQPDSGGGKTGGGAAGRSTLPDRWEREAEMQKELAEELAEREKKLREEYELTAEALKEREQAAAESAKKMLQMEQHLTEVLSDQAAGLANAALGWEDWRDVASQALRMVFSELSKFSALGGQGGGIFDLLLGIGTSALGAAAGGIGGGSVVGGPGFGTARAGGGDFPADMNVLVGERGPEVISSRRPGNVVANSNLGGTTIINHNSFDFRNAIVDEAKINSQISRALPRFTAASEANMSDKRRRGALRAFA